MSDIAIKVENLSKLYQLGEIGTGTLSRDLERWWANVRGKEDPFAKVGQVNDRTQKVESDFVWALKDINFEVKKGEVLGIIGRNGAGKSTLLKILSKITSPTTGKIHVNGRIASLLEVGTGFHPEMTGRENIYMNGALLGMRKWEIDKKFDEIVDFAGIEAYVDTPVKRYSSGMYVRLAFAVAAFLEPEILIVDEVLAVGDADFQKKCLGRMHDISKNDGRTILFVSHNMGAISQLTLKGLVLSNGMSSYFGDTSSAINFYDHSSSFKSELVYFVEKQKRRWLGSLEIMFIKVFFKNTSLFKQDSDIFFYVELFSKEFIEKFRISLTVFSINGNPIGSCFGDEVLKINASNNSLFKVTLKNPKLAIGKYYLGLGVGRGNNEIGHWDYDVVTEVLYFECIPTGGIVPKWESSWGSINFDSLENVSIYE
jgi:lipopolysaccharide transport system ATP-binding protein